MRRNSSLLLGAAAAAAVLAIASPAGAHATFGGATAVAGQTQPLSLEVPHELGDGPYNVDVLIGVPAGWTAVGCTTKASWTCSIENHDGQPAIHFVKAPGSAPAEDENFTFTVTAPNSIGTFSFPTIQTYSNGTKAEWIGGSNPPAGITTKAAAPTTAPPTTAPPTLPPPGGSPTTAAPTGPTGGSPTTVPGAAPTTVAGGAPAPEVTALPGETTTTLADGTAEEAAGTTLPAAAGAPSGTTRGTAPAGAATTESAAGPTSPASSGSIAPLLAVLAVLALAGVAVTVVLRSRRMMTPPSGGSGDA